MYKSLKDNFNNMIMKGFNINDFIEANSRLSVMGTLRFLKKERFLPMAEEIETIEKVLVRLMLCYVFQINP